MERIEEFAVWLIATGAEDAATDDLNEGADPLSERDEPLGDDEHEQACDLAGVIARAISANPAAFIAWYRSTRMEAKA